MIKKIYILLIMIVAGVFSFTGLLAQQQCNWTDFEYIKNSDSWLTCENAAGLDKLVPERISYIEAFFNKSDGDFINYYQSDNSYSFGALTESFYRLKKVVFYGKMNYLNFSGKNMGGSSLLDPYFSSFDIVEYADSTAGDKKKEAYRLTGALSIPLSEKLLLGLKADYNTVGYYKTKDLRHTTDLMNIEATAGFSYRLAKLADIGANYYFRKRVENTSYEMEGNTDKQYYTLISYGAFLGKQESFAKEADGMAGDDENNPFVDYIHGATIQIDLFPESNFRFFNEFGVKWRNGYFGKKSSVDVQYTDHEANIFQYRGDFSYAKNNTLHKLAISFYNENLINYLKSYKTTTSTGGNTTIVYYGKNKVLDRNLIKASVFYTGNLKVTDNNPKWVIKSGVSYWRRNQISIFYPYSRKQEINQYSFSASLKKDIVKEDNMYCISLGGIYGFGDGVEKEDGQYVSASESYATIDRYLYREYEYLTTNRVEGNVGFRYTKAFPQDFRLYGDIKYSYTKAFDTKYIGDSFGRLAVSVGYVF